MSFNTYEFILLFLPIVTISYFFLCKLCNKKLLLLWLTIASLFFYSFENIKVLYILLVSVLVNYFILVILQRKTSKVTLSLGIGFNILFLGFFKYFTLIGTGLNSLFGVNLSIENMIFPLGISFITFQAISLLYDVYKKEVINITFLNYIFYITFFPKVISGPITPYNDLFNNFNTEDLFKINYNSIANGLYLFSIGLFKKVIVADTLSTIVTNGFDLSEGLTFLEGWITSLSYTLQIYFDFSGYSLMALGIAALINIKLPLNFNYPYRATSIKEFWGRWHITLGSFFTKYVYFPLGGNRLGTNRTYLNLFIIFFISGIWHGTGITFVIWGVLHGIARVINQVFINKQIKVNKVLAWILTFNFVNIAWVFFRAQNLESAFKVLSSMFDLSTLNFGLQILINNKLFIYKVLTLILLCVVLSKCYLITNSKVKSYCKGILLILIIIQFIFVYSSELYFLKDVLVNLDYSTDLLKAFKIFIIGITLISVDYENILPVNKFTPNLQTLILSTLLLFLSLVDLNKVSDFIYKSF
ncbi:MAG: MBOAT family O-acyltransferase [Clostridium sp.]